MTVLPSRVRIAAVEDAAGRAAWLRVPYEVFKHDKAWIAPLRFTEARRFSRRHPFFAFGEAQFFVAWRGSVPVGRISAHVNRRHLAQHADATGHFGFFDCADDGDAAQALVAAAAAWLAERGLARMVGPLNFSVNEEAGLPIDGFDSPPAILMTHAPPWCGRLLEAAGLRKEIDLYAYRMAPARVPAPVARLAGKAMDGGRLAIRRVDTRKLRQEIDLLVDIFNDAWSQNWGFVPFDQTEIDALVREMRPFFRSGYGRFVSVEGEPAAVMLGLPDINGLIASFGGRLLPFNWVRLAWDLWRENFRGVRIPLLGIRQKYQHTPLATGILAVLVRDFLAEAAARHLEWVEFSWVLETNRPMNALARLAAGPPVKTFRIYSKPL